MARAQATDRAEQTKGPAGRREERHPLAPRTERARSVTCAPRRLPNVLNERDKNKMVDISSVVFPRKLLKRFIQLYKESPCLWDRECTTYKSKQKRHDAVSKLTELVQEYDSTATRVHVLRKIESLRACVRREHKRVIESRQIASTPDEIYTPQLWYYDLFSFVFQDDPSSCKIKATASTQEHSVSI